VPTLDHNSDLYAEQGCPACAVMCHPGALYEGTLPLLTKTTVIVDRESNVNVTDHAQTTNVLRRQFGRACSWMILPPDFSRHFRLFFSQNRTALFPAPSKYVFSSFRHACCCSDRSDHATLPGLCGTNSYHRQNCKCSENLHSSVHT
jgi:hypothetical protein